MNYIISELSLCAKLLINSNIQSQIEAVCKIKEYLEKFNDESFIKLILDFDIHVFLLFHITSKNGEFVNNILKCIEYLCNSTIYYENGFAVQTAEDLLKSIYFQFKEYQSEECLTKMLNLITAIITKLDQYHCKKPLDTNNFFTIMRDLLQFSNNSNILCATTTMFSSLLSYNHLKTIIDQDILHSIEILWCLSIQKLFQILATNRELVFITICKICENILRFNNDFEKYEGNLFKTFSENVQTNSLKCLQNICIPFMEDIGLNVTRLYSEYLRFLKTLFKCNLSQNNIMLLCKDLIQHKIFNIIAYYMHKSELITDPDEKKMCRYLCLNVICNIIVEYNGSSLYFKKKERHTKFLYKQFDLINYESSDWLSLLSHSNYDIYTKLAVVKFCCIYYIYAINLQEIQSYHANVIIIFLKNIPQSMPVKRYYLRDLWLLTAVIYHMFPEDFHKNYSFKTACFTLNRLISLYNHSLEYITVFHPSIIYWICSVPTVKFDLILNVVSCWLIKCRENSDLFNALLLTIKVCNKVAKILLYLIKWNCKVELQTIAIDILRSAYNFGYFSDQQEFVTNLYQIISLSFTELSNINFIRENAINSTLMMVHLTSYVPVPRNAQILRYTVKKFTECIGHIGICDSFPSIFYIKTFEYVDKIIYAAQRNQIQDVFNTFINSKSVLHTFTSALLSDNYEMSIQASKILYYLMQYQERSRINCQKNIILHKHSLIKMITVSNIDQLLLNIQILYSMLSNPSKTILAIFFPMDGDFIKGLYFRILNIVAKPKNQNIAKYGFKCLAALLRHSFSNNWEVHDYLCNYSGNHTLTMIYFCHNMPKLAYQAFLNFILCWLRFALKDKGNINNKLSINYVFWEMTLIQISDIIFRQNMSPEHVKLITKIVDELLTVPHLFMPDVLNYLQDFGGEKHLL